MPWAAHKTAKLLGLVRFQGFRGFRFRVVIEVLIGVIVGVIIGLL